MENERIRILLERRVAALEAGGISASSVSASAGSWLQPGRTDGSTATGSRDPSASDDNRNTRRGLDRNSDPGDENALCAVLLRCPCEQCHAGISAWIRKHMLQLISQKRSTVKEEPNQLDSFLLPEPSVKISWQGTNKMGSSTQSAARSATPRAQSLCGNPNHKNFGRLEHDLRRYGIFWKRSCEPFSLSMTVKVHFLFQPLIFAPRHSTFLIAGTMLKCRFSGLPLLAMITVIAFLLICLCLECPLTFCSKSLTKRMLRPRIPRSSCDGRPSASSPFRHEASRGGLSSCGALFVWPLRVAIHLCKRLFWNDLRRQHRKKNNQILCSSGYDTATCYVDLVDTAIWLGKTILIQIAHLPNDVLASGLPYSCLATDPACGSCASGRVTFCMRMPMIPSQLARFLDLATTDGDVMRFNLLKYSSLFGKGIHVPIYLKMCIVEYERSPWAPLLPRKPPGNKSTTTSNGWLIRTTWSAFRKRMGRMNSYKPFKFYTLSFVCLARLSRTMSTLVDLPFSSIRACYLIMR